MRLICLLVCLMGHGATADTYLELRDVSYGDHPRQRFDLYLPNADARDLYVIVHGGGWTKGDKSGGDIWPDKVAHWAPKGVAVAALNYRLVPEVTPSQQAEDIGHALKALRSDRYGFEKIVLIGHSAGAHLALLLHADRDLQALLGNPVWDATIALDTSAIDVVGLMQKGPWHLWYDVFGRDPGQWTGFSPYALLSEPGPPILALCSSLRPAPCPQAELLAQKGDVIGQRVDVIVSDKDHLPINASIGVDPDYTAMIDTWIDQKIGTDAH